MKIDGKIFLVIVGDETESWNASDTVELLDTTCPDQGWQMGMTYNSIFKMVYLKLYIIYFFWNFLESKLPLSVNGSTMIPSPTEKGVLMIGGSFKVMTNQILNIHLIF